jgi:regulator of PEP synthase PpsR (kinase-PPPase family)
MAKKKKTAKKTPNKIKAKKAITIPQAEGAKFSPNPSDRIKRIIVVSDATGETAWQMTRAALVQFTERVSSTLYKNIRNKAQVQAIFEEAEPNKDLIIHTIVSAELRHLFHQYSREKNVPIVDLLGPLLVGLGTYFGYQPESVAGRLHDISENYFKRIEAMEYTIQHDDGRDLRNLDQADLIILGISRTSKTPLSMYLSHHGWKVANIPLIRGFEVPDEVSTINPKKVIGLTIHTDELAKIRRARLQRLGQERGGDYADTEKVHEEIEWANEIFRRNKRWFVFDVTGKALEETASEIIKLMSSRRLVPPHSMDSVSANLSTVQNDVKT